MKATLPLAALCFSGLIAWSADRAAAEIAGPRSPWIGAAVLGQADAQEQDPNALLGAAREAMAKGQLAEAEAYLQRAESHWGVLHNPLSDSPKKVRRDLDQLKAGAQPQRPSQKMQPSLLNPLGSARTIDKKDPFQGQGRDVDAMLADKKPQANEMVRKGREALTQGNLAAAMYYARMASETGAKFGPDEDSPARISDEIRRRGGNFDQNTASAAPFTAGVPGEESARVTGAVRGLESPPRSTPGDGFKPLPARPETQGAYTTPDPGSEAGATVRGAAPAAQPSANGRQSDHVLLEARRALSGGDTRRALAMASQARAFNENYGPLDDSPAKVEAMVRKYNDVMQRRATHADTEAANRMYAQLLMEQAEGLILWQDYESAERLAADAQQLRVEFAPFENNPGTLLQRINTLQRGRAPRSQVAAKTDDRSNVMQAPHVKLYDGQQAAFTEDSNSHPEGGVAHAVYDSSRDETRNRQVAANEEDQRPSAPPSVQEAIPVPLPTPGAAVPPPPDGEQGGGYGALQAPNNSAAQWVRQGDEALAHKDQKRALEFYRRAAAHRNQLDEATAQHLQDCLQTIQAMPARAPEPTQLLDEASAAQQRLKQQVSADVARESRKAMDIREQDPQGAVNQLKKTRTMIEASALTPDDKKLLLTRVDRMMGETQRYMEQHKSEIELNDRNKTIKTAVDDGRTRKVQVQERLALLVNDYNRLRDEQRMPEAIATAKQAKEIAPDEAVVVQMWREIHFYKWVTNNHNLRDDQQENFVASMYENQKAATPYGDETNPEKFMDKPDWDALTNRRRRFGRDAERKRSPKEIEIEQKLRTPVSLSFRETPLSEVLDHLKRVTAVNIFVDPQGLAQEGVHPSTPVTIELSQDISLQSALKLILEPLHLGYVVKDEVLKITSEQYHNGNLYTKVYNVADLVIPIPDFMPTSKMGLPQMIADGYNTTNANLASAGFAPPVMQVASHSVSPNGAPQNVLGQQTSGGGLTTGGARGGSSSADFDGLIDLMTKTIEPSSWDEVGGPGSVKQSAGNLSLVISQTQEVHEKIADLLEQLRRLQDLQVTIEVRFITLSDNFFERIGVDFDFNIRDNATAADVAKAQSGAVMKPSATLGITTPTATTPFPAFTPNGDIQFRNNSFNAALPPFGGFDPANAATFGIAILSDIEAFFLVQAAQGDVRSNIMQAPKVTLFNGQAASISDQSQTPFVTSVTPVVGDFAALQAPVIVVLNEGTTLSVQAVVSPDRRFVRLTLIPFFSQIGDVKEFMFTGTTTTNSSSADSSADMGDTTSNSDTSQVVKEGTTIQLPTFIFTTVTTTVSVPDGGTVLLGGVKRLKEGRNEQGVPIMSKIPYISRLFKNVGIGREAQSLMLMVTPRIIIQEEEEEKIGLASSSSSQ